MIRIHRCPEPAALATVRHDQLAALRALGRNPTSDEITGYRIVAEDLWRSQFHKCCYCEARIPQGYNDVEHYRPKASADRRPGCAKTHGYWWLAFSWDNLLFACPGCNRSNKNAKFPLNNGCNSLTPEDSSPGGENPLLIDPASLINPVEHIEFVYEKIDKFSLSRNWWARPRNGSVCGNSTIEVCGLNRSELRELREDHYFTVILPQVRALEAAIHEFDIPRLTHEFKRAIALLSPRNDYVGLNFDALRQSIPDKNLISILGVGWPTPDRVAT